MPDPNSSSGAHAAVIGAGGYVGGQLLTLLARHPAIGRVDAVSPSRAGQPVGATHPQLACAPARNFAAAADGKPDVVFFATPPQVAMDAAAGWLDQGCTVVDCSPDFRLRDLDEWERWYGVKHAAPALAAQAVYALVEHRRSQLPGAKLIAVPGCYATAVQLAAAPLVKALAAQGCAQALVIADCASGSSGAGRRADRPGLLLAEAYGNYQAYALGGHRHAPEILQGLDDYCGLRPQLRFVPHLLPVAAGMFATVHVVADAELDAGAALAAAYRDDAFVSVLQPQASPQLGAVVGTNYCQLSSAGKSLTVLCALDNLVKGAAGQAVQALNVARGWREGDGLT